MVENIDVVIIGAGHIGLSTSFFLKKAGISHVVLEKNTVASTWSTQRWDSFNLVLPNWTLKLPDFPYQGNDPDGFLDLAGTINYIKDFSEHFGLPVRSGIDVQEVSRENNYFVLRTDQGLIQSACVIVATGAFRQPHVPVLTGSIPESIQQMHSSEYRNPSQINTGSVLVIGSGQSGAQIADELHQSGRKVFLSVSRCGGRPRRYRGKDCVWWMQQLGFYDQQPQAETSANNTMGCNVPLTGQSGGVDINLNDFSDRGIKLLGRVIKMNANKLQIADDLNSNLKHADQEWQRFLTECDLWTQQNHLSLPLEPSAYEFKKFKNRAENLTLDLVAENIKSIVWATGFKPAFPWISLPVLDSHRYPIHKNGISQQPGLFFVGLPWQSKRSSSIFLGSTDDAKFISEQAIKYLITS